MNLRYNFNIKEHKDKPNFNMDNKIKFIPYDNEILKIINNTNNLYGITNYGRIVSLKYNIVLKSNKDNSGYLYNCIRINHKNIYVKPHRLVAEYFVDNPNNYNCVNHKDENKLNNHYTNLEWCNHSYNNSYGSRLNRVSKKSGTPIDVYKNGQYICTENSINDCIKKYHVGRHNILDQLKGIRKKWYKNNSEYSFAYKGEHPIKDNINDKVVISFK